MAKTSYQAKINRLAAITEELEKNAPELENAVALFEEGMALIQACEADLNAAEKRIMVLTETGMEVPFNSDNIEKEEGND